MGDLMSKDVAKEPKTRNERVKVVLSNLLDYLNTNKGKNKWTKTEFIETYTPKWGCSTEHHQVWQTLVCAEKLTFTQRSLFSLGSSDYISFIITTASNPDAYFKEEHQRFIEIEESIPF